MFYGFGLGFGLSLIYSPSLTMVGHYWKKRFGIINGIVTSGSAVFTLAMYFLLEILMDSSWGGVRKNKYMLVDNLQENGKFN